jgi:phosphoribosyl 1,2-cyclic phosphodiesterase
MRVKFYGTRGSIPVPEKDYMLFGGNTACVLVTFDNDQRAILDAGSGLRKLGEELTASPWTQTRLPIILSHTHWDHIQGFPFFKPAFLEKYTLDIYLSNRFGLKRNLKSIFSTQMRFEYFPVDLKKLSACIRFWEPEQESSVTEWGAKVTACPLNHPGHAYGYRFEYGGKTLVYCTDVEHGQGIDPRVVVLAQQADLLIHDAQYTPQELPLHKGWGHSSWLQAIAVAKQANVKRLALFHHDPSHNDNFLIEQEKQAQTLFSHSFFAREGMEISF